MHKMVRVQGDEREGPECFSQGFQAFMDSLCFHGDQERSGKIVPVPPLRVCVSPELQAAITPELLPKLLVPVHGSNRNRKSI